MPPLDVVAGLRIFHLDDGGAEIAQHLPAIRAGHQVTVVPRL
jgi:hypothetical protein